MGSDRPGEVPLESWGCKRDPPPLARVASGSRVPLERVLSVATSGLSMYAPPPPAPGELSTAPNPADSWLELPERSRLWLSSELREELKEAPLSTW